MALIASAEPADLRPAGQAMGSRRRGGLLAAGMILAARTRALLSEGDAADRFYLGTIGLLGRTRIRTHQARSHLLYGERRDRRDGAVRCPRIRPIWATLANAWIDEQV